MRSRGERHVPPNDRPRCHARRIPGYHLAMPRATRPQELAASAGGAGLAALTRLVAALRPAAKPLHPRGDVVLGHLRRSGGGRTGAAWLDEAGDDEVLVRRSRAVGLPGGVPDFHGLAIRVPLSDGRHGDLLLATTGSGPISRFVLTVGRTPHSRPLTTLLPYRTSRGPRLLRAVAVDEKRYELTHASATGRWEPFAELTLSTTRGPDPLVSFDPVLNPLPGLDTYGWVRRLREPAYRTARHSRR